MNHFIETGISKNTGKFWFTIHSGSRNFGLRVATYHQNVAEKTIKRQRLEIARDKLPEARANGLEPKDIQNWLIEEQEKLPKMTKGLEYLENELANDYIWDMVVVQHYAIMNRRAMMNHVIKILGETPVDEIETAHNYIDFDDLILRKGAIRAYIGERVVIPFNMRDGMLICEGKSNPEFNFSAPHGAGRIYSRRKAKEILDMDEYTEQMQGIVTSSVRPGTLDEAPGAYKAPEIIEMAMEPTVKILDRVKPILNIKA